MGTSPPGDLVILTLKPHHNTKLELNTGVLDLLVHEDGVVTLTRPCGNQTLLHLQSQRQILELLGCRSRNNIFRKIMTMSVVQSEVLSPTCESTITTVESGGIIIDPPNDDETLPQVALVWYPGGFCPTQGYMKLATAIQSKLEGSVRIWVYLAVLKGPRSLPSEEIDVVLPALKERGFEEKKIGLRYDNVIYGGHSYGGAKAEIEATKNGGGLVTVGTGLNILKTGSTVRSFAQYPLPVLSAVGELDGQLRWTSLATGIIEMLNTAVQMGLKNAMATKYVAIVPGMNHMQVADMPPLLNRGDLESEEPMETIIEDLATVITAFVEVNFGLETPPSFQTLKDFLFDETLRIATPYLVSCGLYNFSRLVEAASSGPQATPACVENMSNAMFGEMIGEGVVGRSQIAHLCEIEAAKSICKEAQESAFPDGTSLFIAPQVVTDLEFFSAASPKTHRHDDGTVVLAPCCYIYRPGLSCEEYSVVLEKGTGAEYWMKLVSPNELASNGCEQVPIAVTSFASQLNESIFNQTLDVACRESVERYKQRGNQVEFLEECTEGNSIHDWPPGNSGISYETDHSKGKTVIQVQSLLTPTAICIQTISPAKAMQYLTIDSLRSKPLALAAPKPPLDYTIIPPEDSEQAEKLSTSIVVLLTESRARSEGYTKMALAFQKKISTFAKCWVAILGSISLELSQSEDEFVNEIESASKNVDLLTGKLEEMGADVSVFRSGRFGNVVFAGHGLGGLISQELAFRRGQASICLSTRLRMPYPTHCYQPMLLIYGELDRVFSLSQMVHPLLDIVSACSQFEKQKVLKENSMVVIPNVNLRKIVYQDESKNQMLENDDGLEEISNLVGDFMKLNFSFDFKDESGFKRLERGLEQSVDILRPYVKALGRGGIAGDTKEAEMGSGMSSNRQYIHSAVGAEIINPFIKRRSNMSSEEMKLIVHPGEMMAMQQFCLDIQEEIFRNYLEPDVLERIKIDVSALSDLNYFIYGQPSVSVFNGNEKIFVTVRSLIERPQLLSSNPDDNHAPWYWIKLKKPSAVSFALNKHDIDAITEMDKRFESEFSGQTMMEKVLRSTLSHLPDRVVDRYEQLGCHLKFGTDVRKTPLPEWVKQSHWEATTSPDGKQYELCLPSVTTPAVMVGRIVAREAYLGNFYIKLPSPAWLVEYITSRSIQL